MAFSPDLLGTRNWFDPVAITWAAIWAAFFAGVLEGIHHRRLISSFIKSNGSMIVVVGGIGLSLSLIGLSVVLFIQTGSTSVFAGLLFVAIGGMASIIVQNHPYFDRPPHGMKDPFKQLISNLKYV